MKAYFMLGLFLTGLLAGWFSRGWYDDSKKVGALEIIIDQGNEQNLIDRELQDQTLEAQRNVEKTFESIESKPLSGADCVISPELVRMWNRASAAASTSGTP